MEVDMVKSDVGHDGTTVKTSNCQIQPKTAHAGHMMGSKSKTKKCALCHPDRAPDDIFDEYYFCDTCFSQL
eukprot:scaffold1606_cov184-Skeletonema_dohrnii-CCMP3373.AAC.11